MENMASQYEGKAANILTKAMTHLKKSNPPTWGLGEGTTYPHYRKFSIL
jgi:hypothetical protein